MIVKINYVNKFNMKKFTLIFALIAMVSIVVTAQPQLTWQFANFEVINAGNQLQFDVEVKADVGTSFHRDLQVYFDYNTAGFGSDIVANAKVSVAPLALMSTHYVVVNSADNTGSKFAVITEAMNEMTQSGSATYFNAMPTTFTGLLQITIDILDNTETAGIVFDQALMNGGQYYQSTSDTDPIKYADPCVYDNNLLLNKLSTVYGNITYNNGASTPLSDITVTLMSGVVPVTSDISDVSGDYNLSSMDDGSYTLENTTTKAWGGLSMNDVQLTRQHVAGTNPLTGIFLLAADVTWDDPHNIAMNDVQLMRQRVAGSVSSWAAPDYVFETQNVTVTSGIGTKTYQGLCSGDIDSSFTPPAK